MTIFARRESDVRGYCRSFPAVFSRAKGALLFDEHGRRFIDLLCGAGSLNYGHNPEPVTAAVARYIASEGPMLSLDLHTGAKRAFLEAFERLVLEPRDLDYKLQFTGPTGTNAVEAAFKLARKVTGRSSIVAFTNAFHGVTQGALAATANRYFREASGVSLGGVTFMPYDGYFGDDIDTVAMFEKYLDDRSSGLDVPAAVIVETVQGEGGLNVASFDWLRRLEDCCRRRQILLIVDDIQAGCGRTGTFFSFEPARIEPDLVLLSKSLGGCGMPMAVVLMKRKHDLWKPAEHNGTFRGNNLAFVAATAALEEYWSDDRLAVEVERKARLVRERLRVIRSRFPDAGMTIRGRGLMQGIACADPALAQCISRHAYARSLIVETAGAEDQVVKCLPPLTIDDALLHEALGILEASVSAAVHQLQGAEVDGAHGAVEGVA